MPELTTILGPDGQPATIPTTRLSSEDAELLRKYKKFLMRYGLREALFCNDCYEGNQEDGCEAHVTDNNILIRCRCHVRLFMGLTY